MKNNSMREREKEKEKCKERPSSNNKWPADFTKASDKSKSRLMAIEGKLFQVNLWPDNKKAIALLLPLRFPDTQTDGKRFKKALNEGLHDISVHIKTQIPLIQEISQRQTWSVRQSKYRRPI